MSLVLNRLEEPEHLQPEEPEHRSPERLPWEHRPGSQRHNRLHRSLSCRKSNRCCRKSSLCDSWKRHMNRMT